MPKGRGSNAARRHRRLAGRHGGGSQGGLTHAQAIENKALIATWRSKNGHLRPLEAAPRGVKAWWRRLTANLDRAVWRAHTAVAPASAARRLEREVQGQKESSTKGMTSPREMGKLLSHAAIYHRRTSSR